jgi:hypothetical protein
MTSYCLYIHHTSLRACPEFIEGANGAGFEMIEHFPFVLSPRLLLKAQSREPALSEVEVSKHSEGFFSSLLRRLGEPFLHSFLVGEQLLDARALLSKVD